MDITPANTNAANAKSPETESTDHPTGTNGIQSAKLYSTTNGVLKRHKQQHQFRHHHHHHHHHHPIVVNYKECLKNHAASMGGHALDGCGEFMPSPTATASDPTSLKCAACGCHRNFHRREPEDIINTASIPTNTNTTATIEYHPHHRHHPPPPPRGQQPQPRPASQRSPNSSSPPPISSSYYPSAPHMLLALSGNLQSAQETMINNLNVNVSSNSSSRKRFRTKFSQSQKDKMFEFAERVGWKMQKRDDEMVQEFCNEVGVDRTVLKVWMHNNKNTFGKRDLNGAGGGGGRINLDNHSNEENDGNNSNDDNRINKNGSDDYDDTIINNNNNTMQNLNHHFESESVAHTAAANGSSSSS